MVEEKEEEKEVVEGEEEEVKGQVLSTYVQLPAASKELLCRTSCCNF